jgi:hypothetical protein
MAANLKKVTINIPEDVLARAREITRRGITETVVEGLLELDRRRKRSALRALRGRVSFELDLQKTRR